MWSEKQNQLNLGWGYRLPLVGPPAQVKSATGGTTRTAHPHRPRRVPAGYSSIGLVATIARLRFTGKPILKPFRDRAQ
jgi:hypothetical protein